MKIFFYYLRPFDELPYCEEYSKNLGIDYAYTTEYPHPDNVKLAEGCEAVCATPCDLGTDMVERFAAIGVKYIMCRSIGYDHVDLKRAAELGIRVSNISYPPAGVANYAVMLMLMTLRKIVPILDRARIQDFTLMGKMGRDISYCTVGVIGAGKIGRTVIRSLSGFGCRILAYDPFPSAEAAQFAEFVSLDELLSRSDIITLHSNATPESTHLINAGTLAKCRDGVIIINTSRGKLIDTDDLIRALKSGKVGGAALDVLENENDLYYYDRKGDIIDIDDMAILRSMPNVILSPHTAFYTEDAIRYMVGGQFESAKCYMEGIENPREVFPG